MPSSAREPAREQAVIARYHERGPETCPRCKRPNVVQGRTMTEGVPVWVCDWQDCAIIVAWRDIR